MFKNSSIHIHHCLEWKTKFTFQTLRERQSWKKHWRSTQRTYGSKFSFLWLLLVDQRQHLCLSVFSSHQLLLQEHNMRLWLRTQVCLKTMLLSVLWRSAYNLLDLGWTRQDSMSATRLLSWSLFAIVFQRILQRDPQSHTQASLTFCDTSRRPAGSTCSIRTPTLSIRAMREMISG